jgi:cell filamentation protein
LADNDVFCAASSEIHGEFLSIHPFREGNARTIKLMNNLLAAQTGRPLLAYDMSSVGQNSYIDAARAALAKQDYKPLETIIRQALETAKSDRSP